MNDTPPIESSVAPPVIRVTWKPVQSDIFDDEPAHWHVEHPLYYGHLSPYYHAAKWQLVNHFNLKAAEAYRAKAKGRVKVAPKLVKSKFLKKACALIRELRSHGLELKQGHWLQRWTKAPQGELPDELLALLAKDRVFRGCAIIQINHQFAEWNNLMKQASELQKNLQSSLLKPFRRMLAQGKISVKVAIQIAIQTHEEQQNLLNGPKWMLSGCKTLDKGLACIRIRETIHRHGRSPAVKLTRRTAALCKWEYVTAIDAFGRAGGTVPTSLPAIARMHAELHRQGSPTYEFVNNRRYDTTWWKCCAPLPSLPPMEGVEVKVIATPKELRKEGRDMGHCVGMYAGLKGLFAHLERGEDKATLFVDPEGRSTQCYSPGNKVSPLSSEIMERWVPVLSEWVKTPDLFELQRDEVEAVAAPVFD